MQTLAQIRELLAQHGLSPRKSLGQNFLIDHNHIQRLVRSAGVGPGARVLEVGPGTGTLTEALLDAGAEVVACELDRGLASLLRDRFAGIARFTLIEGDCLRTKHALNPEINGAIGEGPFSLVANLPYGAATPLMATLVCDYPRCAGLHVTIQREVALRMRAEPRTPEYAELSVVVQALCEVRRVATLPASCFWPAPKVTSEMVSVTRRQRPLIDDPRALAATCRRVFGQRRKQIGSLLPRDLEYPVGIEPTARAESLSVEQLVALAGRLGAGFSPGG